MLCAKQPPSPPAALAHLPALNPFSLLQWPGVTAAIRPPNAGLRLFGGAAFERALQVGARLRTSQGAAPACADFRSGSKVQVAPSTTALQAACLPSLPVFVCVAGVPGGGTLPGVPYSGARPRGQPAAGLQEPVRTWGASEGQGKRAAERKGQWRGHWAFGAAVCHLLTCRPSCNGFSSLRDSPPSCPQPNPSSNGGGTSKAAEELARSAAREALGPLLDTACARLGAVVKRAYEIAVDQAQLQKGTGAGCQARGCAGRQGKKKSCCALPSSCDTPACTPPLPLPTGPHSILHSGYDALRPYVAFHAELQSAFKVWQGAAQRFTTNDSLASGRLPGNFRTGLGSTVIHHAHHC